MKKPTNSDVVFIQDQMNRTQAKNKIFTFNSDTYNQSRLNSIIENLNQFGLSSRLVKIQGQNAIHVERKEIQDEINFEQEELSQVEEISAKLSKIIQGSSNIAYVEWEEGILAIRFHSSDKLYKWDEVPEHVYHEFISADSVGSYFCRNIKNAGFKNMPY